MSDDELFCAALELETEGKQRELIESLCANDPEQLARVWSLLDTHRRLQETHEQEDSQSILDRPGVVFQAFSGADELKPGKHIGKYVLCELIGQGATSFVFRAKQTTPMARDVALKLLKPGMDSQRILARFGLEHQVIKRLEHPGITPVLDVGVQDNGRPFFAMELVPQPLTIAQYAEQSELDLTRCIQLMIETCEIVQHAHQRGVIHRDLKPSNILIEGNAEPPKPRIIDFGIAKIMQSSEDSGSLTTLGDRFGTPAYMSPEQALMPASSVDIRSDVYSLGVILYELLTGDTPRAASAASSIDLPWTSEAYWEYEIQSPSRANKSRPKPQANLPSLKKATAAHYEEHAIIPPGGSAQELDWIVLKAIAKDPLDRYQTVADMQRDLQRFLNGEPVEAAGPSLAYRIKKLVRRNRAISAAAALTLATILVTSVLTASFAFRARTAEQQVRIRLQETLDTQKELLVARDRAEEAKRQSQSLLRVYQVQAVTNRSLSRFLQQRLDAVLRGEAEAGRFESAELNTLVAALSKPHDRLIVRGDWSWASSTFPIEMINAAFRISSREALQAMHSEDRILFAPPATLPAAQATEAQGASLPPEQQPFQRNAQGDALLPSMVSRQDKEHAANDLESLQVILLDELRKVLPKKDPFIAEVLDNCGLQALEMNAPEEAVSFLRESVDIWDQAETYPANLAQSQLFLAEALLRMGQEAPSVAMLEQAQHSLAKVPANNPDVQSLRALHMQLQSRLKKAS